jgi:RNA polymerase sigma-70 factor (ECF subfamily)
MIMNQVKPNSDDTEKLLQEAQAGDEQAFEDLFARHRAYLTQVIAMRLDPRLRTRVDPSDVVQEAQLVAFRRFGDFVQRRPMAFRLWLRKTACERLLMLKRFHQKAAQRSVDREVGLPDGSAFALVQQFFAGGSAPSKRLEHSETARRVREVMAKLSEADREILLMRNLEELSNQEVAEILHIEPVAASQRYGRALLRLRKLLVESGLLEAQS